MPDSFMHIKTLVVKLGTTLLAGEHGFEGLVLEEIVKDLAKVKRERAMNLLLVSSGAMGCGVASRKWSHRDTDYVWISFPFEIPRPGRPNWCST